MSKRSSSPPLRWSAARVKGLRQRLGLTQEQFAARLGVTFVTANRWEMGRSTPTGLSKKALDALEES
jgi:DNA-binding transcriptional regulator YiaG